MMLQCPLFPENHNAAAVAPADMTVAEWQRARLNWLQQQQHQSHFTATSMALELHPHTFPILPASTAASRACSAFVDEEGPVFHEPGNNMPPSLVHYPVLGSSFVTGSEGGDGPVLSCPPVVGDGEAKATPSGATASPFDRHGAQVTAATECLEVGRKVSSRKRKAPSQASTRETEDEEEYKRTKGDGCCAAALVEPKLEAPAISSTSGATATANPTGNKEASSETSKEKGCEPPLKSDYIHVRARRGQATDSHSLAERVRREKISNRMKLLQDLVPGCNRITGKAGVLDEIINYVQSLQRQVEFLSMKLAAVSPAIDSNMDAFFTKEILQMIPHCGGVVPPLMGVRPPELLDASFLIHDNTTQTQQAVVATTAVDCGGLDIAATSSFSDQEAVLLCQAAASAPDGCSVMDSHKVRALATVSPWEAELHGLYSTVHELQQ